MSRGFKAVSASIALVAGVLVSALPASATTAPALSTMDRTIVGSGSDTTYDLMMAIDKVYNAANGCATIFISGQPKDGSCDTNDSASGNGADKTQYPWVNDSHAVIKEVYPVGSGNGAGELCAQGTGANATTVRHVDFARASSKRTSCSDLQNVAYGLDAVSWYHFTKDRTGANTPSAKIASLGTATLSKIYDGTYKSWSELNNKADVLDADGLSISDLPNSPIIVYVTQSGSGTYGFFAGKLTGVSSKMLAQSTVFAPTPSPSASPSYGYYSTNQENFPAAIYNDGNEGNAIYFMSIGRYKQLSNLAATGSEYDNSYSSATSVANGLGVRSAVGSLCSQCQDAMGQVAGVEPTATNIQNTEVTGATTKFSFARRVYNVLRYPSAAVSAYAGTTGWLCTATDSTKDRIKQVGYRTLINNAIISEGFQPLPVSSGSYCRLETGGTADTVAPTITLASPSPTAKADGTATIAVSLSEQSRGTDASKLTVTQAGNASLSYTVTATNAFGGAISAFNAANNNNDDPYWQLTMKNLSISVSNIAYDADGTHPVVVSFAAGAVADPAGNNSASTSFNIVSRTTAPVPADVVAPTVSGVSSLVSGKAVWTATFSEPVRSLDTSKFTYVKNAAGALPAVQPSAAPVYTCANSDGVVVPCSWAYNTNAYDPSGVLAIKSLVIKTGLAPAATAPISVNIAAGAFVDAAGNNAAPASLNGGATALADVADTGTWTGSTATAAATRTVHVYGGNVAVTFATGANGGVASVMVDGVLYDTTETANTVGLAKGVNLYTPTSGTTTVTVPVTVRGWHTVKVTVAVASSSANTTGYPSKRLSPKSPAAPYSSAKKATFVSGTTVTINSITAS